MHTVIADECTGCDLCLPPCPVDCIDMVEIPASTANWRWPDPDQPNLGNLGQLEAEQVKQP